MEKAYTKEEYKNAALQANAEGKFLYRVITQVKYTITVLEWEDEEQTIPKMIKKEVPVYDDDGELIRIDIIKVQASHEEDAYKDVEVLDIKPFGYYYLLYDNLTDGSVNQNYAKDDFEKNFFNTSLVTYVTGTSKGNISSFSKINSFINPARDASITKCLVSTKNNPDSSLPFLSFNTKSSYF